MVKKRESDANPGKPDTDSVKPENLNPTNPSSAKTEQTKSSKPAATKKTKQVKKQPKVSTKKPKTEQTKSSKPAATKKTKQTKKQTTKKPRATTEKPKVSTKKPKTEQTKSSKPAATKKTKQTKKPTTKKPKATTKPPKSKEKKKTKKQLEEEARKEKEEREKTFEEELEKQLSDEEIQNFQIEKVDMERLTNKVCEMLAVYESTGLVQTELWKKLKLTNRDGSRLALKLERTGFINREKILEKGRWTYKLILKKTPISTMSIENAPCLTCSVEQKCSVDGEISPRTCHLIENWVIAETKRPKKQR